MKVHSFSDTQLLNDDLAYQIKKILYDAIAERGHAYLVVSGGKTPLELFKLLAQTDLPWDKVTITLADERCVAHDSADSNARLVKDYLLQHQASQARFIHLYEDKTDLVAVEQDIASLPAFDAVILGMGEDGHTASLFPCSDELSNALDDNAAALLFINPKTAAHQRISLSKKRLLNSRAIFLHLVGEKKQNALNRAMAERDPMVMPVCAFLNAHSANLHVMFAPH